MRNLLESYQNGDADLLAFYAGPSEALFSQPPVSRSWDASLAAAVQSYNERLGNPIQLTGAEVVIATGQQPAIFTGPLYCIYKAITAIQLAAKIREQFQIPCIPLYWVASDDHDLDEAATAHFPSRDHKPFSLTYTPETIPRGASLYRIPIEPSLHDLITEAASVCMGSEFRAEVEQFLHDSADASASLADWTARLMAKLFQGTGLVLFSPHLLAARAASISIFETQIEDPTRVSMLVNETGARLKSLGFLPQLEKAPQDCAFFLEMGHRRRKVIFEHNRFFFPEEHFTCTHDDMREFLRAVPDRFTANAALRCLLQQHLFPVAAYVAGPGELAYWAQLKPVFEHFGLPMPIVYPRAQAVLTARKVQQIAQKLNVSINELTQTPAQLVDAILMRQHHEDPARTAVKETARSIDEALNSLGKQLESLQAGQEGTLARVRSQAASGLARIEHALAQRDQTAMATLRAQVERLCHQLAPFQKPQERVYSIFGYTFQHGWDLIPRIMAGMNSSARGLQEIEL